jgi:aspartate/methionine/tyrosine aminotransferase
MNTVAEPLLRLAARVDAIQPVYVMELAKEAAKLERAGRDIIHMGIGEPDFTAPEPVVEAAAAALRRGVTQYTSALGLHALREAIAAHYQRAYGLTIDPARVVVTAGASAALLLACAALVDRDDEVLMPDPSYPCNRHFVAAAEGKPVLVPSGPQARFQLTAADVERLWTPRTRGVLLASPSNPTGTSIEPDELNRIVQTVRARGGFTIVDEIYQGLSYDAPPISALSYGDDVVTVNSFSKYFNMTGWRLGWLVLPDTDWVREAEKLAQHLFISPSTVAQHAALAAFLPQTQEELERRRDEFARRRHVLLRGLETLGLAVPAEPTGAFYAYADVSALGETADRLAQRFIEEAHVAVTPGRDFGEHRAEQFLRFAYTTTQARIAAAIERLAKVLRR